MKQPKNIFKYCIGLGTVIVLRLMPHPPNVEPIMTTMMPFAKKWGWIGGLLFTLIAMLSFDVITGTLGMWSMFTIITYSLISICAGFYFKRKKNSILHYIGFSVMGTLVFDAVTGLGVGMFVFKQTFMMSLFGQIPFTLYHLAGNVLLAGIVSPLLYRWVVDNPQLETRPVIEKVRAVISA